MKLVPVKIQNTKITADFLKKSKYAEKKKFLENISDLMSKFIFAELKSRFVNLFAKDQSLFLVFTFII